MTPKGRPARCGAPLDLSRKKAPCINSEQTNKTINDNDLVHIIITPINDNDLIIVLNKDDHDDATHLLFFVAKSVSHGSFIHRVDDGDCPGERWSSFAVGD